MFTIDTSSPMPIYAQLEQAIKLAVISGAMVRGAQMPTVRQLAVDLKINANTVSRVYMELEQQGVLETKRGIGTFVTADSAANKNVSKKIRKTVLVEAVRKFLNEISTAGYSPEEIIEAIQAIALKEK